MARQAKPVDGFIPIPGNAKREAVNIETGEVISRRQYQQLSHGGKTIEKVAEERLLTGATGKGVLLYKHDVTAWANKHNITTAQARKDISFKYEHAMFRKELKELDRWRDKFFKEHGRMPHKGELAKRNPDLNKRLNKRVKDMGKKSKNDYSDFGSSPDVT
jgi:hypothetical protein